MANYQLLQRRTVLVGAVSWGMAIASEFAKSSWPLDSKPIKNQGNIADAIARERGPGLPAALVSSIEGANYGPFMAHIQLFSGALIDRDFSITTLNEFCTIAEERLRTSQSKYRRRLAALPAMAFIHALPTLQAEYHDHARDVILKVLDKNFDTKAYEQFIVIKIVWQTALAATIRSKENWENIVFSDLILDRAEGIIDSYFSGNERIFGAAIAAFQFLLTYRQALRGRKSASALLRDVDSRVVNMSQRYGRLSQYRWFRTLADLYASRTSYDSVLPQQTEIIMGPDQFQNSVSSFIFSMRMKEISAYHLEAERASGSSSFFADSVITENFQFFRDFGIGRPDWNYRRMFSADFLTNAELKYIDAQFERSDAIARQESLSDADKAVARRLGSLVPFHRYDEDTVFRMAYRADGIRRFAKNYLNGGITARLIGPLVRQQAGELGAKDAISLTDKDIQFKIDEGRQSGDWANLVDFLELRRDHVQAVATEGIDRPLSKSSVSATPKVRPSHVGSAGTQTSSAVATESAVRASDSEARLTDSRQRDSRMSDAVSLNISTGEVPLRAPTAEQIDAFLASIIGKEEDEVKRAREEVEEMWATHPLHLIFGSPD